MTAEQLKASVLQMAIEGKLVPQLDAEPAVDIEAVEPEEVPFAIPEKWKWVTLGTVATKIVDGEHKTPTYVNSGVPFVTVKNFSSGKLSLQKTKFVSKEDSEFFRKRCDPEFGDILISKDGTIGNAVIVNTNELFSIFVSVALVKQKRELVDAEYLINCIQSPYVQEQAKENTRGVAIRHWVLRDIASTKIPLPPLSEQHRIVARLNEILPLIEEYGKAHSALKNAEQALPDQLRASLLQEAIQGKLVPQLDDEPAVDMAGEEPDEVPFAIPEKWKWVTLLDIVKVIPSKNYQIQAKQVLSDGALPVVSQSKNYIDGYSNEQDKLLPKENLPIILFGDHTRVVKFIDFQFVVGADGTKLLHPQKEIDGKFLYHLLQFNVLGMRNRGYSRHFQFLKAIPVPLPPLAEQRRIVARLEELLPHVDAIAGVR